MSDMTDVLGGILSITGNLLDSDLVNRFMMIIFTIVLVFGILNCILGYRLLRFWMMLGGFFVGGGLALIITHSMGTQEKSTMMIAAIATGVVFAVIAFLIYKAGVFILAAGIGWALSIYFLHPTSSASFFVCILIGVALGTLAVKYCREVLIIATSLIGGVMSGIALAKLGSLSDFPYGIGMSIGFAVIGMLIQFAINKPVVEEDADAEVRKTGYAGEQNASRSQRTNERQSEWQDEQKDYAEDQRINQRQDQRKNQRQNRRADRR